MVEEEINIDRNLVLDPTYLRTIEGSFIETFNHDRFKAELAKI